jgi:hypothetical protein
MQAFEAWLEHLFDRPPGDLEPTPWYHRLDDPPTEWTLRYEPGDPPSWTETRSGPPPAGTGAGATLASAEWLSRNYRQLDRRCRNGEYGIMLAFAGVTDPQSRFPREISTTVLDLMFDGRRDH